MEQQWKLMEAKAKALKQQRVIAQQRSIQNRNPDYMDLLFSNHLANILGQEGGIIARGMF